MITNVSRCHQSCLYNFLYVRSYGTGIRCGYTTKIFGKFLLGKIIRTMTSAALSIGCGLLAFSPFISTLIFVVYSKVQLVIVVTTSAFAFLLSSLLSSLIWLPFPGSMKSGSNSAAQPLLLIPVAVISQALLRYGFVKLYLKVEGVIEHSIRQHERTGHPERNRGSTTGNNETSKLSLELNDWACGLAAGTGFGGMHAIMLFGTLLASEAGMEGTLYQPSCKGMPSLVNSALLAFFFSILDFVLMFLTFYGVRRQQSLDQGQYKSSSALFISMLFHALASFATVINRSQNGCAVSLPLVALIVFISVAFFVTKIGPIYLPKLQRDRIIGHSTTVRD